MSNNFLPSTLTMESLQMGQFELVSNKIGSPDIGLVRPAEQYSSMQQSPMETLQLELVGAGLSDLRSSQLPLSKFQPQKMEPVSCSSNVVSMHVPVSSYQLPLTHSRVDGRISHNLTQTNLLMAHTDQQMVHKTQGQTILFQNHPREVGSMFKLPPSPLLTKRKAIETAAENFKLQQLPLMNKRMVPPEEHRPWLQPPLSKHHQQPHFSGSTAGSPRSPSVAPPKKSQSAVGVQLPLAVKKAVPPRGGPVASSPKESFESVRSKLRESLSAALSLAAQSKDNDTKESDSNSDKGQENSQAGEEHNIKGSDAVESRDDESKAVEDSSVNKSGDSGAGSPAAVKSDSKGFQPIISLSDDDVSFSDSFFVKDELLQGNGLAWVMESDVMLTDKKMVASGGGQDLRNDDIGCSANSSKVHETPETLAYKIEAELYKLFRGVNKKYKEKGRSLLFNLKDRSNPELGERVLSGEISPERLCSMTAEELASKELSQWRIAKAEELAQMVVLPDTGVDIRRLVKKTHKGEFQVELEEPQNFSVLATPGTSVGSKDKAVNTSKIRPEVLGESSPDAVDETKQKSGASDVKSNAENASTYTLTIPSTEGNDLMQGLMVDDELKDTEFLPPIVSLDEFMESLDTEPPFEDLPKDAEGTTSDKDGSSESKSPSAGREPSVEAGSGGKIDVGVSEVKSNNVGKLGGGATKSLASTLPQIKGERIWDGLLQLNISVVAHVTGVYKSGEKTSAKEWPCLIEVKGRVKLEAFGKFLQELPLSRSRAVMAMHFVCRSGTSESDLASLREVADSYVADGRVGFAEPSPGVELYVCPAHGKTAEILNNIFPKDRQAVDAVDQSLDSGLIGVVVWRKVTSISPKSAAHHKHNSKRQHLASRRPQEKDPSSSNAIPAKSKHSSSRAAPQPKPKAPSQPSVVEAEDDVPPGFGPQDEDDLPEFNFSAARPPVAAPAARIPQVDPHALPAARPVDEIRQLIHKYGQQESKPRQGEWRESKGSGLAVQPWNDDDDDDDMPEWRPEGTPQRQLPALQPAFSQQQLLSRQLVGHTFGHQTTHATALPSQAALQQKASWTAAQPYSAPPSYGVVQHGTQWPASDSRGGS